MYGYDNNSLVGYVATDFVGHFPFLDLPAPPLNLPPFIPAGTEFDSTAAPPPKSEVSYSSSGCSSYGSPSSRSSYSGVSPSLIQRSASSVSLQKNINGFLHHLVSTRSLAEFMDSDSSPIRRVFTTGDLQRTNMEQHYHRPESQLDSVIEGMSKACRYSPEEKRERIERYRSKRNQRNFNKKIKYACRKTLADSRPRIRGRFARNDEIEKSSTQHPWSHMGGEEDYEEDDDDNWISFLDSFSGNLIP